MPRIRLIHWNEEEAAERAERLVAMGYHVDEINIHPDSFRTIRQDPPDCIVIDLSRLPAQGRDAGLWVRNTKATRHLPLVFVDGRPEKIERVQQSLPDAVYTTWGKLKQALPRAIANPPTSPVVPKHVLAGYSGTPLPKKLGIKPDSMLTLLGAPADFETTLGTLPSGVTIRRQARGHSDLVLWFPKSLRDLEDRVDKLGAFFAEGGGMWICWPKKSSGVVSDFREPEVRRIGLASGLVDYKICSIDETYSGLKFSRRK